MIDAAEHAARVRAYRLEFARWLARVTYAEAERAYRSGVLSADGWVCYLVLWAFSAPRFSYLAEAPRLLVHAACREVEP